MALRTNKTPEVAAQMHHDVNTKLEQAIEELRVKYEKKAEAEAAAAESAARAARAEEAAKPRESDWAIEGDDELERLRRSRMDALKSRTQAHSQARQAGGGALREIVEADFLKEVTGAKGVVVHFFHPEFVSCAVMDKHLRLLAARCPTTRFLRVHAEKAPFFVGKLKVKVLPSLVFFVDGVAVGRQTGFQGLQLVTTEGEGAAALRRAVAGAGQGAALGRDSDFKTLSLYKVLKASGVLGAAARERADSDSEASEDEDARLREEVGGLDDAELAGGFYPADYGVTLPRPAAATVGGARGLDGLARTASDRLGALSLAGGPLDEAARRQPQLAERAGESGGGAGGERASAATAAAGQDAALAATARTAGKGAAGPPPPPPFDYEAYEREALGE